VSVSQATELGLADLRDVEFSIGMTEDQMGKLRAAIMEWRRRSEPVLEVASAPQGSGETLPPVSTAAGPVRIDIPRPDGLRNLTSGQITDQGRDYDPKSGSWL
jgi:hypothetical protein